MRSRAAPAIVAGLLLAASFPKLELAGVAWVAPGLMLLAAAGANPRQTFKIGYLAGSAHYLASLSWLLFIPFPAGAIAGWLALSAYLALYPAVWVWLCWRLFPIGIAGQAVRAEERPMACGWSSGFLAVANRFLAASWSQRAVWAFCCAALWVTLEMVAARFLTGFPWNFLGVSQYKILPLIQIASVTGVYGISFLVVWVSAGLLSAAVVLARRPLAHRIWLAEVVLPLLAAASVIGFGVRRLSDFQPGQRTLKVTLVQPSIPQTLIWNPKENTNRFDRLIRLSEAALATKPDLLIWPEAAVPNMLRYDSHTFAAVTNLVRTHKVWMILGADDAEPKHGLTGAAGEARDYDFFNSSFALDPNGNIVGAYQKRRLVIFGEYVPLARWLPFLKHLTPIGDNAFTPGKSPTPHRLAGLGVTLSVLICFEDTFPLLARESVAEDTDFLLNLTNNGWFGESASQWQHAANGLFRAVENGLPLVRCANNGLTCWVDALGRMHEVYFGDSRDIYGPGFKTAQIPLLSPGQGRELTFYARHGDWFGWSCVGWAVLAVGSSFTGRRQKSIGSA
ncbi:MAG: apolipoprotein N-acyltransferase [Verrucomicrobiota bacterium]